MNFTVTNHNIAISSALQSNNIKNTIKTVKTIILTECIFCSNFFSSSIHCVLHPRPSLVSFVLVSDSYQALSISLPRKLVLPFKLYIFYHLILHVKLTRRRFSMTRGSRSYKVSVRFLFRLWLLRVSTIHEKAGNFRKILRCKLKKMSFILKNRLRV